MQLGKGYIQSKNIINEGFVQKAKAIPLKSLANPINSAFISVALANTFGSEDDKKLPTVSNMSANMIKIYNFSVIIIF